ncbi:DGQHR domain-containing protein [Pseudoalteromonas agarivorans]|uniref:DGQHR domain-containing protein n=1 Tax=Pseudoalteromonas agarivorans TaxID=176102 RepID=UPI002118D84E|nr:DGQHR domain-containing protein [Pseudoalteromonas agarivorans]MCQ8820297.1 DGQHR domain-containing protein [Pseudoalteromonas agarivorans]
MKNLMIPCLKGKIGSWFTYTSLMTFEEIANLIHFADDLHKIKKLSQMIQRRIKNERATDIASYINNNKDHFFNSLVIGIYEGDPTWHEFDLIKSNSEKPKDVIIPEYASNCFGYLSLTQKEKMFALDGQHRLAGIKQALIDDDKNKFETLPVVIVSHKNTPEGLIKSRRLFTTLNKKAELVKTESIIALDEDDICACVTRDIIEKSEYFNEENISFTTRNLSDKKHITTIGAIYKNIQELAAFYFKEPLTRVDQIKYSEGNRKELFNFADEFYTATIKHSPELQEAINESDFHAVVAKYRANDGNDHLLFRPLGWDVFTQAFIALMKKGITINGAVNQLTNKSLIMSDSPFINKIWTKKNTIKDLDSDSRKNLLKSMTS